MLSKRDGAIAYPLRLSEVIVRPGIYTNSKRLSVSGLKLTSLDKVGEQYRKVEELNLKNNLLQRLGEIGQFTGLRVLDISNNKIADQKELLKLATLRNLQVLHVAGNPFLQTRLTSEVLAVLDRLNVELNIEPSWTIEKPDDEQRLQNIMLENYTEMIFMQSLYRKTEMHIELVNKYTLEVAEDPDYRVLLRHKDAILELDQFISHKFVQQLRLDAYALKKTLSLADVTAAYKDLIERQTKKKAELLGLINQRSTQLKDTIEKKRRALSGIRSDIKVSTTLSPKKTAKNSLISPLKITTIKQLREQTDTISPRASTQTHKKSRSPIKQQNYEAHYYKNLTKRNPVYHLLYSPLHSLKPKEKDLLIQTLSSNLKEKSIELYRKEQQIRLMEESQRLKMQQLVDQVYILDEQKNQLAKRLLEYETTVTDFHFDVKGKLRLEKEVDRKQTELVQANANSQLYKEMYERVCQGVQYMAEVDRKQQILRDIADSRRKTRYFSLLYYKYMRLRNLQALHTYNEGKSSQKLLNKCFILLKRNNMINSIIKLRTKEKDQIFIERGFYSLVNHLVFKNAQKTFTLNIRRVRFVDCLKMMSLNAAKRKALKLKYLKATRHQSFVRTVKAWRVMKAEWVRYNDHTLKPMSVRTDQYYRRKLISKALLAWIDTHQIDKQKRNQQLREVERRFIGKNMARPFFSWINEHYHSRSNFAAKQMLLDRIRRVYCMENVVQGFFKKCKKNLHQSKNKIKKLQNLFKAAWQSQIFKTIETKSKQFYLQSRKTYEKGICVLTNLRTHSRQYLGHHIFKLHSFLMSTRVHTFYSFYLTIKSKRLQLNLIVSNLLTSNSINTLSRVFNGWRYKNTRELLSHQRQQLHPIIEDLRSKEQHYIKLNSILREELAAKDDKLKLYDKKIQNLNYEVVSQNMKFEKLALTYEENMGEMRVREMEFMEVIGKLQDKFELVSAEVDQLAKDEIKKEYQAQYSRYSRISDLDSTVRLRQSKSPQQ